MATCTRCAMILLLLVIGPVFAQEAGTGEEGNEQKPSRIGELPPMDAEDPAELKTEEEKRDGRVVRKYTYYVAENGREVKHGVYEQWYPNGKLQRECTYEHGRLVGLERWFYPNGNRWKEVLYKDGRRHGQYREFYPNGKVKKRITYHNGHIADIK